MKTNRVPLFIFCASLAIMTLACSLSTGGNQETRATDEPSEEIQATDKPSEETQATDEPGSDGSTGTPVRAYIEQVSNQAEVPADGTATVTATCPEDSLMLGGGFASGPGMIIKKTMPDPAGWLVHGVNNSESTLPLTAYAYCLHGVQATTTIVTSEELVSGYPKASCKIEEITTGGGYAYDTDTLLVYISTPLENPHPYAWAVYAQNLSQEDQPIRVYAVCLAGSGLRSITVRDNQVTYVPEANNLSFTLECPEGAVMSQGGYEGTGAYISRTSATDEGQWEVQVQEKVYFDGSLDHAVCLYLP